MEGVPPVFTVHAGAPLLFQPMGPLPTPVLMLSKLELMLQPAEMYSQAWLMEKPTGFAGSRTTICPAPVNGTGELNGMLKAGAGNAVVRRSGATPPLR